MFGVSFYHHYLLPFYHRKLYIIFVEILENSKSFTSYSTVSLSMSDNGENINLNCNKSLPRHLIKTPLTHICNLQLLSKYFDYNHFYDIEVSFIYTYMYI